MLTPKSFIEERTRFERRRKLVTMGSIFFKRWDFLGNALLEAIDDAVFGIFKTLQSPTATPSVLNPTASIQRRLRTINKIRRRQYEELDSESSDEEEEEQRDTMMEDEPELTETRKVKSSPAPSPRPPPKKKSKKTSTAATGTQDMPVITQATVAEMRKNREEAAAGKKRASLQKVQKSAPPAHLHPSTSAGVNMDSQDLFRAEDF